MKFRICILSNTSTLKLIWMAPLKLSSVKSFDYNHKLSGKYKTNLRIKGSVTKIPNQTVWKKLTIDPGTFYDCIMPEQIEALWGPVPLGKLPPGIDNECKAVTHRYTTFS